MQSTISNLMKMAEPLSKGLKTLWEKEELLVTSNFSFSHSVFNRLVLQTHKNMGLFGKWSANAFYLNKAETLPCVKGFTLKTLELVVDSEGKNQTAQKCKVRSQTYTVCCFATYCSNVLDRFSESIGLNH